MSKANKGKSIPKFKVGDTVRVLTNQATNFTYQKGDTFIIDEVNESSFINTKSNWAYVAENENDFWEYELELVKPSPQNKSSRSISGTTIKAMMYDVAIAMNDMGFMKPGPETMKKIVEKIYQQSIK